MEKKYVVLHNCAYEVVRSRCMCQCHSNSNIIHFAPCCDDGYVDTRMKVNIDVTSFKDYTHAEYFENLQRLKIDKHASLVGHDVYYGQSVYGIHHVIDWSADGGEYLLELDEQRFWSNPFRIKLIE